MTAFDTLQTPLRPTVAAPDGSDVRVLLGLQGGGMATFELAAGAVSTAVTHRTIEEIWYVLDGQGEMWRRQGEREDVVALVPGPVPDDSTRHPLPVPRVGRRAAARRRRHDAAMAGRRRSDGGAGPLAADGSLTPRQSVGGALLIWRAKAQMLRGAAARTSPP